MNKLEDIYYVIIGATFIIGLILGATLFAFFAKDCQTRNELCAIDIKQNQSLQKTLNKQESMCLEKIDATIKRIQADQNLKFNLKYKRLQEACNILDCAQCKR